MLVSGRVTWTIHYWGWFRNPTNLLVEVDCCSNYLKGLIHPKGGTRVQQQYTTTSEFKFQTCVQSFFEVHVYFVRNCWWKKTIQLPNNHRSPHRFTRIVATKRATTESSILFSCPHKNSPTSTWKTYSNKVKHKGLITKGFAHTLYAFGMMQLAPIPWYLFTQAFGRLAK